MPLPACKPASCPKLRHSRHMALHHRPYNGAADAEKISELLTEIDRLDPQGIRRARPAQELRAWLESPEMLPENVIVWEDARGMVRGYALIECSRHGAAQETLLGDLRFANHPANRADDLDGRTIAWAEARLLALGEGAAHVELQSTTSNQNGKRIFTLTWHGFQVVRHFVNMQRPLSAPTEPPRLPEGFTLRLQDAENEAEAWVDVYNNSFVDHWQFTPVTLENYHYFRATDPRFRPEHNWVIVAPDGTFAALCWCLFDRQRVATADVREALLHQIGTRRGFRGMGLASALIQHVINALRADPLDLHTVRLWVDIENPTAAKRLYEKHGFVDEHTLVFYQKTLKA